MNSRQRLLTALSNQVPDYVPCAPDLYEMVPIRLSGRPSWEILLYQDPPPWKARIDACLHYGVDAFVPLGVPLDDRTRLAVVRREPDRLTARAYTETENGRVWDRLAIVMGRNDPSSYVLADFIGLPATHETFEPVTPNYTRIGRAMFEEARDYLGDRGVVAPAISLPCLPHFEQDMLEYYRDPEGVLARKAEQGREMMRQAEEILSWNPDVLMIGNSGMMLFNPPDVFRAMTLDWLKQVTRLARERGVLTHIHCCGPERSLIEIAANETDLTSIEPLEIPPMGDCNLREIKQKFGHRLAFKGNLHTTSIMLQASPAEVEEACKRAIDDAAEGGGFILSTGDQTPRDVPDQTIATMLRVAQTYGRY